MGRGSRINGRLWGWNKHHRDLSDALRWAYKTRRNRPTGTILYIEWCRGSRKSTLLQADAFCKILDDPNLCLMVNSDKRDKAMQKTDVTRALFEDPYVQMLWGDRTVRGQWSSKEWTVARTRMTSDPTMEPSGLDVSKTGKHKDIIYDDDCQTDDNCDSPTINEDVKRNYRLYQSVLTPPGAILIVAGTRWGFHDLGADIQAEYEAERKIPGAQRTIFIFRHAAYPTEEPFQLDVLGFPVLDTTKANFPEAGLGLRTLAQIRKKQKASLFSFNYLLRPRSEERATFKAEWVRHHDRSLSDFSDKGNRLLLSIDPAGDGVKSGKVGRRKDSWAFVVIAVTPAAEIFTLHASRDTGITRGAALEKILALNTEYSPQGVIMEQYFFASSMASWMRTQAGKRLIKVPWLQFKMDQRSKDTRVEDLQPFMEYGKLHWRKEHTDLETQTLEYPQGEHDDLPDCLAQAVKYASIPRSQGDKPWYMNDKFKDEEIFIPSVKEPVMPSDLAVKAARALYRERHAIKRKATRFLIGGRHGH